MKSTLKIIGKLAAAIALAAVLPTIANAQITYTAYNWVYVSGAASTGSLVLEDNNGAYSVTTYNFYVPSDSIVDDALSPDDPFDFSDNLMSISAPDDSDAGNSESGQWYNGGPPISVGPATIPFDLLFDPLGNDITEGYWSEVPEPSTIMAGMLLLVPLAVSTFRIVRRNGRFARVGQQSGENSLLYPSRIQRRE